MDMVEVTALVPREKLGRFYALVADLVTDPEARSAASDGTSKEAAAWRIGDNAIAREIVEASNRNAHKFLRLIAERAGRTVPYDEIDAALGMTSQERSGLQGAVGRTASKRGYKLPWETDYIARTVTMDPSVATMFLVALGDRGKA